MPGPLVSSAATSALMATSLDEFPKQTLIAARARVKYGSCPSTSECVARAGSGSRRQAGPEAESKPIEQVIGSIFSADANVMAKTEADQVGDAPKSKSH